MYDIHVGSCSRTRSSQLSRKADRTEIKKGKKTEDQDEKGNNKKGVQHGKRRQRKQHEKKETHPKFISSNTFR